MSIDKKSIEPAYRQLEEILKQEILNTPVGASFPNEKTLSLKYKLGRNTVRKALENLVDDGFIIRYPGKGTVVTRNNLISYGAGHPEDMHPSLIVFSNSIQGMGLTNFYASPVYNGILSRTSLQNAIVSFMNPQTITMNLLEKRDRRIHCSGILWLSPPARYFHQISSLSKIYPTVVINRIHEETNYVFCDHYRGAYNLTKYLIEQGHGHIGFFGHYHAPGDYLEDRCKGIMDAMKDGEIDVEEKFIYRFSHSEDPFKTACKIFRNQMPTAIFITGGEHIIPFMKAANENNIRIPEELSVVSFDELPQVLYTGPPITNARQPLFEMGSMAAKIVLDILQDGPPENPIHISLDAELMIRNSCGKPVRKDSHEPVPEGRIHTKIGKTG